MTTAALRSLIFPTHLHTLMIHLYASAPVRARMHLSQLSYLLLSEQSLPKEEFLADAGTFFLIRFHWGKEFLFNVFEWNIQIIFWIFF